MGLFKKKNPQDAFDPDVFTITDTILDPPRFTFLPAIYQDATRRKWAVHQRGATPRIFDYADVLQCEIVETGNPEDVPQLSNRELAQQILINPAQATKNNAAKRNMCLGMGVVVAVQTGEDEISKLEIPVTAGEVKRDCGYIGRIGTLRNRSKKPSTHGAFGAMMPAASSGRGALPMSSEPYAIPPKDRAFEGILWYIKHYDLQGGDRLPPSACSVKSWACPARRCALRSRVSFRAEPWKAAAVRAPMCARPSR